MLSRRRTSEAYSISTAINYVATLYDCEFIKMNDRELLELAAKAAGYEASTLWWVDGTLCFGGVTTKTWKPLTDDGDALRLAVKANIDISHSPGRCGEVEAYYLLPEVGFEEGRIYSWTEPYNDDPYAATRRAIVRAAAEIGKEMK